MGLFDNLFPWREADDMTEIEHAIAHNEARGDGAAIPKTWHEAAEAGVETFDEAEKGGWLRDLDGDQGVANLWDWRKE